MNAKCQYLGGDVCRCSLNIYHAINAAAVSMHRHDRHALHDTAECGRFLVAEPTGEARHLRVCTPQA